MLDEQVDAVLDSWPGVRVCFHPKKRKASGNVRVESAIPFGPAKEAGGTRAHTSYAEFRALVEAVGAAADSIERILYGKGDRSDELTLEDLETEEQ